MGHRGCKTPPLHRPQQLTTGNCNIFQGRKRTAAVVVSHPLLSSTTGGSHRFASITSLHDSAQAQLRLKQTTVFPNFCAVFLLLIIRASYPFPQKFYYCCYYHWCLCICRCCCFVRPSADCDGHGKYVRTALAKSPAIVRGGCTLSATVVVFCLVLVQ